MRRIPYSVLIVLAVLMALQPIGQQPHLVEKLGMLASGTLRRPIDIFDLFLHGTPLALLVWKVVGDLATKRRDRKRS